MLTLTSPAFEHGGTIPKQYTCDGDNVNPELRIAGIPEAARSLALVMEDPDAPVGTFTHWIVWNIPPSTSQITVGVKGLGTEGTTSFGRTGYGGPCPPPGKKHRYYFKVYALDTMLELLTSGANKSQLELGIEHHLLAVAELTGLYGR
jgi:hypothetical protein